MVALIPTAFQVPLGRIPGSLKITNGASSEVRDFLASFPLLPWPSASASQCLTLLGLQQDSGDQVDRRCGYLE